MKLSTAQALALAVLTTCCVVPLSTALTINVYNESRKIQSWVDDNAYFNSRSYNVPVDYFLQGQLVYPEPRNACTPLVPVDNVNATLFAFIDNYYTCRESAEDNIAQAGFKAMIAYSSQGYLLQRPEFTMPRILINAKTVRDYLVTTAIVNITTLEPPISIKIKDDSFKKLERLFIIFGSILLGVVALSICVFCSTICCRIVVYKWRTRGLTRWQVRQLPKRKYRKAKETSETCSICLEEFKEGESIRVLPCDHVFHPKCVDEWLQKWNRTCPLCKSTIKRKSTPRSAALETTTETSPLLATTDEERGVRNTTSEEEEGAPTSYGAAGYSTPLSLSMAGRGRGSEGDSSDSHPGYRKTLATVEVVSDHSPTTPNSLTRSVSLSLSRELSPLSDSIYHTPPISDDEGGSVATATTGASFKTTNDDDSLIVKT